MDKESAIVQLWAINPQQAAPSTLNERQAPGGVAGAQQQEMASTAAALIVVNLRPGSSYLVPGRTNVSIVLAMLPS